MHRRHFTQAALAMLVASQFPSLARAQQIATLKMMIPANPGGGWDQTGRELAAAMQSAKAIELGAVRQQGRRRRARIGLAQFVNASKGDPNALMMGGMVMVGGIMLQQVRRSTSTRSRRSRASPASTRSSSCRRTRRTRR